MLTEAQVRSQIANLKTHWYQRNAQFTEWYQMLTLVDQLQAKNMESYVSNEPLTFYNMAHYLLTKGELVFNTPILSETAIELDRRAKIDRACKHMWTLIDQDRQSGGLQPFIDELGFFLLVTGWYSIPLRFDSQTGLLDAQVWNPYEVYPLFHNRRLQSCVHSYRINDREAAEKAQLLHWNYDPPHSTYRSQVTLDDFFTRDTDGTLYNMVLINGKDVTGWVPRPEMNILVSPVGGFPDKGSLTPAKDDWRRWTGRGIFAVNEDVNGYFNKWKSMVSQILRDTAQPITQEFSATPQATPQQIRERGAFFHYAPGELGLQRIPPGGIPIEVQAHLLEIRRELQKGSFNDAVYGMVEGQPGYALSQLATSSANQILYPYMDAKHWAMGESSRFWLTNLKSTRRVFEVKGKFLEKLTSKDIPDNVILKVDSEVAVAKDWLERGTIGGMMREDVDQATLLGEVYKFPDPQAIIRRKELDDVMNHPMTKNIKLIAGYQTHAKYLEQRGDVKQAMLFRRAAQALEAQFAAPPPGQGQPTEMTDILAQREAGAPQATPRAQSRTAPPETRGGFTPQQLRDMVGNGRIRRR